MSTPSPSLFLSPAFLLTEIGFLLVASFAAYELFIGDFAVWESRRVSDGGDGSGAGVTIGYGATSTDGRGQKSSRREYHRSLSPARPGGRSGAGSTSDRAPLNASRRLSSSSGNEDEGSGGGRTLRGGQMVNEEGYYSSPGDVRYGDGRGSPGRGSTGDRTRRLFYKLILVALLSRFFLLPIETFCFDQDIIHNKNNLFQILLRISQTLPDVAFASALGLLVIFCAQIAFAALPPLSPRSSEGSFGGDDEDDNVGAIEAAIAEGDEATEEENDLLFDRGFFSEGGIFSSLRKDSDVRERKKKCNFFHAIYIGFTKVSRTILASKQTFTVWNSVLLLFYVLLFFFTLALPLFPVPLCEISLWVFLVVVHCLLLVALFYVGGLLGKALRPSISRKKGANALACRLVGTCILLAWVFSERIACFSSVTHRAVTSGADLGFTSGVRVRDNLQEERRGSIPVADVGADVNVVYRKDAVQYALSELLPVLLLLFMMHRKKKGEIQSDVHIIHSIMTNCFGSSGRLGSSPEDIAPYDTNTSPSVAGDTGGNAAAGERGGTMGSRRFQTYGGTRGDSFPPISGNRAVGTIGRASSSSGGIASSGSQSKQNASHIPFNATSTTSESSSLIGNTKLAG